MLILSAKVDILGTNPNTAFDYVTLKKSRTLVGDKR